MIAAIFVRYCLAIALVPTETERIPCLLGFVGIVVAAVTQKSKESIFKMHHIKQ